jgi:ABC-type bacteriocin/lantibiotic exporter with double-glycine peptidase domain
MGETNFLLELVFIFNLLCKEIFEFLSVASSNPLFSCIVSLCSLILIYLPYSFFKIIFSPVLILTGILFLIILRFGSIQRFNSEKKENLGESESITNEENRGNRDEKQGKTEEQVEIDSFD